MLKPLLICFSDQRLDCGGIRTSLNGEIVFSQRNLTVDDGFSSVIRCIWLLAATNQEVTGTELEFTNINIDSENNCSDNSIQVHLRP